MGRPIISGVNIEPQPACIGQPVVVQMRGADPDGFDNQVIYEVWGNQGNPTTYVPKLVGKVPVMVAAYNLRGDYDQRASRTLQALVSSEMRVVVARFS